MNRYINDKMVKKIMKKMFTLIKRLIKWYMKQLGDYNSYVWCPSGMIPYNYSIKDKNN